MLTSQWRELWQGTKKVITQAERCLKKLLQTTGISFKLSAQSSPRSAQSSPWFGQIGRRVYLSKAKAYKHDGGIAGKLSPCPFDSCTPRCDTEHAIVATLRKARKGHVNGDPGLNQTSAWPVYMYAGQDRGGCGWPLPAICDMCPGMKMVQVLSLRDPRRRLRATRKACEAHKCMYM